MLSSKSWVWVMVVAVTLALGLCGCGGGDGGSVDQTVGNVSGHIEDFTAEVGIGNVTVTIGGHSAVSDANGDFLVEGIAPGTYTVSISAPAGTGLVLSGDAPTVTVIAGDTTVLSDTVYLMDENDVPPDPPTG